MVAADDREIGNFHSIVWPAFLVIMLLQIGFATSLALVEQNHGDVDKFMQVLRSSALYAPTFDKKLPKMLSHDYGECRFISSSVAQRSLLNSILHTI